MRRAIDEDGADADATRRELGELRIAVLPVVRGTRGGLLLVILVEEVGAPDLDAEALEGVEPARPLARWGMADELLDVEPPEVLGLCGAGGSGEAEGRRHHNDQ